MSHLIDAERLIQEFSRHDVHMPLLVFGLLSIYLDRGPFEFDATALSERLSRTNLKARVNPEEMAALQTDLENFFEPTEQGWVPRPGILAAPAPDAETPTHARAPGELSTQS